MIQHDPAWQTRRPGWMHIDVLIAPHDVEAAAWQQAGLLNAGEAEAIALARQTSAHWLLTDDAAARLFAQSLGLVEKLSEKISIRHGNKGNFNLTRRQIRWLN